MYYRDLSKLIYRIFKKHNLSSKDSKICSDAITQSELVEATSHGLSRLKMYCDRINKKVINPKPKFKIKKISQSIYHIDADKSIGFVAAQRATDIAIKTASSKGFAMIGVKNSGHYGASSYYINQAVKKNLIALCFTNAPSAIAPYGSKKKMFGTNPISFGAPTKFKYPFIFDSSMSIINRGKIRLAAKQKKNIPYGVALDKSGKITTNPKKALEGVQLPIAGFRGSGLAWMVDILSGIFTGAAHGKSVRDPFDDFSGPQNVGHLFIFFKSSLFTNNFSKRIKESIINVKKLPKTKGTREIFYPGQQKYMKYNRNLKKKIKIPNKIKIEIKKLLVK